MACLQVRQIWYSIRPQQQQRSMPGWVFSHFRVRSFLILLVIPLARLVRPCVWASGYRKTFVIPMPPPVFPISGEDGISLYHHGCATIYTFHSAAIVKVKSGPM